MSFTNTFSFSHGYTMKTSLIASCITILESGTDHIKPVMGGLQRTHHTAFKKHPSLVLKVPAEHPKNSLREAEVHCRSPHHSLSCTFSRACSNTHNHLLHCYCTSPFPMEHQANLSAPPLLPSVASHFTLLLFSFIVESLVLSTITTEWE